MKHSIFAFEICAKYEPGGRLHSAMNHFIRTHPANATLQQKWELYRNVIQELLVAVPLFERGCWDYFDNDARALKDYDQWVNGMLTEEGSRKEPAPADPYRGAVRYMTFTMAFLLVNESPTDLAIRRVCQIPESELWHRATFQKILQGTQAVLNFASIKSDVLYLIPRDPGWGLTQEDLAAPKFHYLRPLG